MEKFWMVLVDGTEFCRVRHSSLEDAKAEVERLLLLPGNQGKGATILEAVEYGKAPVILPVEFEPIGCVKA